MTGEHRKKHRFNLVDIFLILVAILCIVGIVFRDDLQEAFTKQTAQIDVTCRMIQPTTTDVPIYFEKNTKIYLADGTLLGTCKSVEETPNNSITLVVSCQVQIGDGVFLLNSTKISCNRTLNLHTSLLSFDAVVLSITEQN